VLAFDGSRFVGFGKLCPRRERRLAEQVLVSHVADGRVVLCLLGNGMAEQHVRRRCRVDDERPFK
jgi:hypothetical protein